MSVLRHRGRYPREETAPGVDVEIGNGAGRIVAHDDQTERANLTGGVGITKLPPWDVNTLTKK